MYNPRIQVQLRKPMVQSIMVRSRKPRFYFSCGICAITRRCELYELFLTSNLHAKGCKSERVVGHAIFQFWNRYYLIREIDPARSAGRDQSANLEERPWELSWYRTWCAREGDARGISGHALVSWTWRSWKVERSSEIGAYSHVFTL